MSKDKHGIKIHPSKTQVTAHNKAGLNPKIQSSINNKRNVTDSNINLENWIVLYIHENHRNGICSKQELSKHFGSIKRINKAIKTSDHFVAWGEGEIILVEKIVIRPSDRKILVRYFEDVFEDGWTSPYKLFEEMKIDRRLAAILREKGIDEAAKLASIIKLLLPEVKGHANFLYFQSKFFRQF